MADSVGSGFPTTGINKGHTFYDLDEQSLWMYLNGLPRLASSWRLIGGNFVTDPDTSIWGSPQTGAMWYNSSDGIYKGWSGSEVILITSILSSGIPDISVVDLVDDFIGTGTGTDGLPILGWQSGIVGTGSIAEGLIPIVNHPGMWRIRTGSTGNDFSALYLGSNGFGVFSALDKFVLTFVIQTGPDVNTNTILRVGADVSPSAGSHTNGVFIEKQAADTQWQFTSSNGGTTRVNSNISVTANTFYRFDIRRISSSQIGYRINLGAETIISTNTPVDGLCTLIYAKTIAAEVKDLFIDYCKIRFSSLVR